jgi:coenzyme F420-0:L-glutamate ligase/coenzyme F420-1:gamma-L-glutamate ligase
VPERTVRIRPLAGLPEIQQSDDLGALVAAAASPEDGDIVVLSQKVVSKAEGRLRGLAEVSPSDHATELAAQLDKDPRLVELILAESRATIRAEAGVLITETRSGWICANSGIDSSNVGRDGWVALLPEDADASARRIRGEIKRASAAAPAVVIADSFGRPWRRGQTDVAIGCAGLSPLDDWRGRADAGGRELTATVVANADELAAAADLAREKDSGSPGAVITGLDHLVTADDGPGASPIRRAADEDLFR